jgi:hypothetical protein
VTPKFLNSISPGKMLAAASWRIALPYSSTASRSLAVNLLQPEVERHHSPFNIEMADDNAIAEIGEFVPRLRLQQRQQRRRDLPFLQHEIFKLLGIRHPPDAVMLFTS